MRTDAGITIDLDDDVIGPATITHEGAIVNPRTRSVMGLDEGEP